MLIPYVIAIGCILSGIIAGIRIEETSIGKIFYDIITAILTILPAMLAIILAFPFITSA